MIGFRNRERVWNRQESSGRCRGSTKSHDRVITGAGRPRNLGLQESRLRCTQSKEVIDIKGIKDIRFIFIVAALVVVAACGTSSPPVQLSPVTNTVPTATPATPEPTALPPTPSPTPTPEPSNLPPAVQVLSADYQEAFKLLPSGPWAQRVYAEHFDDFSLEHFKQADDTPPPTGTKLTQELDAGDVFNLSRALKDAEAQEWIAAKVAELAPFYKDEFAKTTTPEDRLRVIKMMVSTNDVAPQVVMAEIFTRWLSMVAGSDSAIVEQIVGTELQWFENSRTWAYLSDKEWIIRHNERRVCELIIWDIVQVGHTLDVISGGACDLAKVVQMANGAIADGRVLPTEADYRERVEAGERLRAAQ